MVEVPTPAQLVRRAASEQIGSQRFLEWLASKKNPWDSLGRVLDLGTHIHPGDFQPSDYPKFQLMNELIHRSGNRSRHTHLFKDVSHPRMSSTVGVRMRASSGGFESWGAASWTWMNLEWRRCKINEFRDISARPLVSRGSLAHGRTFCFHQQFCVCWIML